MYWHIETDIVCLVIMLALFFDIYKRSSSSMYQDKVFRTITLVSVIVIVIDVLASLAMEFVWPWWLYQTMMVLYYASLLLLPMLWLYYVRVIIHPKFDKKDRIIMWICLAPGIAFSLISLSNPLTGLLFTLTPDMVYARGPLFSGSILLLIFYCIVTIVIVIWNRKNIVPPSRAVLLIAFFFIVGIGVFFQLAFPGLLVINAAFTVVFVMTYYYIQNRRTIVDGLTGLYNRGTGEQRVSDYIDSHAVGGSAAFIITDLDNFKTINDTMGHRFGDTVLKAAADACVDVLPNDAIFTRLGGDEFMILVDDYESRESLGEMLSLVNPELQRKVKLEVPSGSRQISMSMGVSFFPEQGSNFVELYENADIALYQAKWSGRNRFAYYNEDEIEHVDAHALIERELDTGRDAADCSNAIEPSIKTMLIVDDSEIDHAVLSGIFADDFVILHAEDCESALRLLRRHGTSITIVLLDLLMPGKTGFDFLCEKSRNTAIKNIPVIVVTASDDQDHKDLAFNYGAADIVLKPIDPDDLRRAVDETLAKYNTGFWYNDRYQRELLNLANVGLVGGVFCVHNDAPDYTIDYISHSLLTLLGYDNLQEMLDAVDGCWKNCLMPEDYLAVEPKLRERLQRGFTYSELEYRLIRKDGSRVLVRDNGKLADSVDGLSCIVGICFEIDDVRSNSLPRKSATKLKPSG